MRSILLPESITRRRLIASTLALGSGLLTACESLGLAWRYRYRLTGEVECRGNIFRGSSVIEVTRTKGYNEVSARTSGEAAVVDIPNVGKLFLLLYGESLAAMNWPYTMPHYAFKSELGGTSMTAADKLSRLSRMQGSVAVLTADLYPMLVHFTDLSSPTSVQHVDARDLEATFGQGAMLKSVEVEVTNDKVTRGIRKVLPWLGGNISGNVNLDGTKVKSSLLLANVLDATSFERL